MSDVISKLFLPPCLSLSLLRVSVRLLPLLSNLVLFTGPSDFVTFSFNSHREDVHNCFFITIFKHCMQPYIYNSICQSGSKKISINANFFYL